jgi:hypothetical protein
MLLLPISQFNIIKHYTSSSKASGHTMDPYFITGLTEGSFSITKHKEAKTKYGMSIGLRFKITMLVNEKELIEKVKAYFGFGSIFIHPPPIKKNKKSS